MIGLFIQRIIAIWFAFLIVLFQKTMYTMEEYQNPSKKSRTITEIPGHPSHFNSLPKELIEKIARIVAKNPPSGFNDLSNFINTCKMTRHLIDPTEIVRSIKKDSVDLFYEISKYLATTGRNPKPMQIFAQILPLFNTGTEFYDHCLALYQESHDRANMLYALKNMELLARAGFFKQTDNQLLLENTDTTQPAIKTIMPKYIEIIRSIPQEAPTDLSPLPIEQYPLYRKYSAFFELEAIVSECNKQKVSIAAQLIRGTILSSIEDRLEHNHCSSFLEILSSSDKVKNNRATICQFLETGSLPKNFDQQALDYATVIEFLGKQLPNSPNNI